MPNAQTLLKFCEHYWQHPYWKDIQDPWIRLELLPSAWLRTRAAKARKKVRPLEVSISRSELNEARAEKILGNCDKGYDIYYFCNVVPHELAGFAENKDVIQRLWLPIDLDYRLPIEPLEFAREELGVGVTAIIETSNRAGYAHHQMLVQLSIEQGRLRNHFDGEISEEVAKELCQACFSDSVTDAKRILRLPGTLNWKKVEKSAVASEVKFLWGEIQDEQFIDSFGEMSECLSEFIERPLYKELRELSFKAPSRGGVAQGPKGDYGSWDAAYEKAEKGIATVTEGGRHNALISWGGQMSRSGIAAERIKQNLIFLGRVACSPAYFGTGDDGGRDFLRMWSYLSDHIDRIRKEETFDEEPGAEAYDGTRYEIGLGEEKGEKGAGIETPEIPPKEIRDTPQGDRENNRRNNVGGGLSNRTSKLFHGVLGREEPNAELSDDSRLQGETAGPHGNAGAGADSAKTNAILPRRSGSSRPSLRPGSGETETPGRETQKVNGILKSLEPTEVSGENKESKTERSLNPEAPIAPVIEEEITQSPMMVLEAELKAAEILALGKFKNVFSDRLITGEAGLGRAARLVVAVNQMNAKGGDESRAVDVFQGLFKGLHCHYGEYYSAIAKIVTGWGASARYTVGLSERGLLSVIDHGMIDVSRWVRKNQTKLSEVPEVVSAMARDKKFGISVPASGASVGTIVRGLCRRVGAEFASVKAQPRSVIVFQNGVFDLRTGIFLEDDTACLRLAHPLMCRYVAESPQSGGTWQRFLEFAFPDDAGTWEAVYRMMGYCSTSDTSLQKIFMLEGITGSGKSTLSGVLMSCLGVNNATAGMYRQLAEKDSLSQCENKIFCSIDEAESGEGKIHTEAARRLKEASSGQPITLRPLHQNERVVTLPTKFILLCNKGVQFEDTAGALARRLVTFRFNQRVSEADAVNDVDFRAALLSEADAIMSEAARRFGAAWSKKETMFEGLGSKALEEGRAGAMDSLDPVGSVVRRYVRVGEWELTLHEGVESRDFLPSGVLINAALKTRPELWDRNHGRTWVQREAARAMKTNFGAEPGKHRLSNRMECRGYRGFRIDIEKLIEEVGLEQFCKGLDQSARKALEEFYHLDLTGISWDSEEVEEIDLNH